jgi:uncharacterized membrane protein YbhN (UPF0104 family)
VAAAAGFLVVGGALVAAAGRGWLDDAQPAVMAATGAAVAALVIGREYLPSLALRVGWWGLVPVALLSTMATKVPLGAELLAVVAAATVGSLVAVVLGTPTRAATASAVAAGLEQIGLRVDEVTAMDVDARASTPWRARLVTGREVFVKTHSSEQRSADLLFRMWRVIRLRRPGDGLPHASLRRAVEHEAFVSTRAAAVGVRTPKLINVGRLEDGVFAAYEAVDGRTMADVGEEVPAAALRAAWSMSQAMHRSGIAHRDLRAANVLVDQDGEAWIIDFGFAEVAATPEQILHDTVELVASTAAAVGVRPAVAAAMDVLGPQPLIDALPYVQPAAVCHATRRALGRGGFAELRRALIEATGAPEPEAPNLERVRPKTILTIVALGIALWVLLPQVAQQTSLWQEVTHAHRGWMLLAVLVSASSYVAGTLSLLGAVPGSVPFFPTLGAQVASSFTNRITPGSVGGLALNTRYLARAGTGTAAAATSVGLSASAGAVVHILLTVFALAWAGTAGLGDLQLPEPRTLAITGALVLFVVGVGLAVPASRRFLLHRLAGPVRQSVDAVREVATHPVKLAMLFGGSALVTVANIVVLAVCLQAFGATVALSTVAVVYLAGSAIGSAAPTPGGLGALEATLVAGFTATSVDQGAALAAVLLFRLATFWLPILPGWIAFATMQRRGWI